MGSLTVTPKWANDIGDWDRELRAAGRPRTTCALRNYHIRRLAHDHRDQGPREMTYQLLIDWSSAHDWKPETRRSYRASLRLFFRWMHATGRMPTDIAFALPGVKPARPMPRPCPDDVIITAAAGADLRTRLMLLVLSETGMRRGELAVLRTDHLERDLHGWYLRVLGKGAVLRRIPVTDDLARIVRLLPAGFAFPGQVDGHLSAPYVGKLVSQALGPGYTAHTIRHRFATLAYAVERDLRAVQGLLGHAKPETTAIYTQIPEESRRRAMLGAAITLPGPVIAA